MELITGERLTVVVPRQLLHPMCHWQPDVPQPDLGQIAWLLSRRAKGQSVSQGLYWATPAAARRFGGVRSGQINRPFQIDHDLGVLEMFFAVRKLRPQLAESWIDEERLAAYRRHQKLPDAIVAVKPSAPPQLVLEYGGNYSKYRLQDFHEDNRERGLPYEIW